MTMATGSGQDGGARAGRAETSAAHDSVVWLEADEAIRALGVATISDVGNGIVHVGKGGASFAFRPLMMNGYACGNYDFSRDVIFAGARHDVAIALQALPPALRMTDAELILYREVKGNLARQVWKDLEQGASFDDVGLSFGRDGRFTTVICRDLTIASVDREHPTRESVLAGVRYAAQQQARPFTEVLLAEFMAGQMVSFVGTDGKEREAQYRQEGRDRFIAVYIGEQPEKRDRMEPWQAETYFLSIGDPVEALAREARAERVTTLAAIGDIEGFAVLRQPGGAGFAIMMPEVNAARAWGLLRCDMDGVWDCAKYDRRTEALDGAIAGGYTVRDDALLDRMLAKPSFNRATLPDSLLAQMAERSGANLDLTGEKALSAEVAKLGLVVQPANRVDGKSYGSMVGETDRFLVQGIGQGRCVVHRKADFNGAAPAVGQRVQVMYSAGRAAAAVQNKGQMRQHGAFVRD